MGAYLSEPITEKVSTDEEGTRVICGASSMQGWRKTQEDAHNSILEYDTETSFFAVYDGHGGHEVAEYSAEHLPEYLKTCEAYKAGDYTQALKDAFLGFDAMLTTPKVKKILRQISRKEDANSASEEDEEENFKNLYEEAKMPLEQVMAKYQNDSKTKTEKLKQDDSKPPASPYLRARRSCDTAASSSKSMNEDAGNGSGDGVHVEEANTSNGDSETKDTPECAEKKPEDGSGEASVSTKVGDSEDKKEVNGEVLHGEDEELKENSCDSDETSKPHENGEVAESEGKGKGKRPKAKPEKKRSSLRLRNASTLYRNLLGSEDQSDSDSDDEGDESFEGADNSSEEDEDDEGMGEDENEEDEDSALDEEDEDDDDEEEDDDDDDDFAMKMTEEPGWDSGCTAVVALLKERELYVANAGDSRCIVCRKGQAIEMSLDHKPEDEAEMKRIVKAGGKVNNDGRVNGGLNLSRALGDHGYKQREGFPPEEQMITALPDVRTLLIDPEEDEFMVLACDGIWNFMSSQDVVDFVRPRLLEGKMKLSQICEELFDHCLAPDTLGDGTGCDNMTAVIVKFRPSLGGETKSGVKRPASPLKEEDTNKRPKTEEEVIAPTSQEEGTVV